MDEIHKALVKQFGKRKAKAAELNWGAAQAGFDYAAKTFTKTDPYRVERMNADRRQDHHRRQRGLRAGRHVRRRHGGDLVSHHALVLAGGIADRLHAALPPRSGNRQGHLRHRAGGGRAGLHRHGARRRLGGRPLHDRHRRPGHLADVRIHRPGLLRRIPGGDLRRASASGPPPACPRAPRRATSSPPRCSPTATPSTPCSSRARPKSASPWPSRPSISPSSSRPRSSS